MNRDATTVRHSVIDPDGGGCRLSSRFRAAADVVGDADDVTEARQWILPRNCALGPAELAACLIAVATVSIVVGTSFAMRGYWMVLPFAGLESLALAAGFLAYSRHAADRERIVAVGDRLVVEQVRGGTVTTIERTLRWVRVDYDGRHGELIRLVVGNTTIEVGRYVPGERRGMLAHELRSALSSPR